MEKITTTNPASATYIDTVSYSAGGASMRTVQCGGTCVQLHMSLQRLCFGVTDRGTEPRPLCDTAVRTALCGRMASIALVAEKVRIFESRLLAAMELMMSPVKENLLRTIAGVLTRSESSSASEAPQGRAGRVRATKFVADALARSHPEKCGPPCGFYAWSPELRDIWYRDRLAQHPIRDPATAAALRCAVGRGGSVAVSALEFVRKFTAKLSVNIEAEDSIGIWPRPEPRGPSYLFRPPMLAPLATEGCHLDAHGAGLATRNAWALVPLVRITSDHVTAAESYTRERMSLYSTLADGPSYTSPRHVLCRPRSSGPATPPDPRIWVIRPDLAVEPAPEYYRRKARVYAELPELLGRIFDSDELHAVPWPSPEPDVGTGTTSLFDELARMRALFDGLANIARLQLGMDLERGSSSSDDDAAAATDLARTWLLMIMADPDLWARDMRRMVPTTQSPIEGPVRVLCHVGYCLKEFRAAYSVVPGISCADCVLVFRGESHVYPCPVVISCTTKRLLNDAEFAALCDRYRTPDAIAAAVAELG